MKKILKTKNQMCSEKVQNKGALDLASKTRTFLIFFSGVIFLLGETGGFSLDADYLIGAGV